MDGTANGWHRAVHDLELECAGKAVVQMMEDQDDRREYAVKFFLDRQAFLAEAALYAACFPTVRNTASPAVLAQASEAFGSDLKLEPSGTCGQSRKWRFLPSVSMVCDESAQGMVDPKGRPLPPCIVTEYGLSLQDWLDRQRADNYSAYAVSHCYSPLTQQNLQTQLKAPSHWIEFSQMTVPFHSLGETCSSSAFCQPLKALFAFASNGVMMYGRAIMACTCTSSQTV